MTKTSDAIWDEVTTQAVEESGAPYRSPPEKVSEQNPSGIQPSEFKVLILQDEVEKITKGGIHIPDEAHERDQYAAMTGVIIAVSPLAFTYENWPEGARKPSVGDRVVFAKYAGAVCKGKDGVEYRLVNDRDICAVMT
jgi:co-chaperonin GroES (HSP10)